MTSESAHNRHTDQPTENVGDVHDAARPQDSNAPHCLVVMYHYVHDEELLPRTPTDRPLTGMVALETAQFIEQVACLSRDMEPIDWPTLYAWIQGRGSIPHRSFLLTFDDGLADHARAVRPVLDAAGIRGTFFVPGAVLASHRLLPAHAVHLLLSVLDDATFERELFGFLAEWSPEGEWEEAVDPVAAERMYHYETPERARLKYLLTIVLPIKLRNAAVQRLFENHVGSAARWARRWYLGWDDLVDMQARGHTIGGHGFSHEPYLRLSSAARRDDMRRSFAMLQTGLGSCIRPFSYPFGSHDADVASVCRNAGFVHGFTTRQGWVSGAPDTHSLPRVDTIDVDAVLDKEHAWLHA